MNSLNKSNKHRSDQVSGEHKTYRVSSAGEEFVNCGDQVFTIHTTHMFYCLPLILSDLQTVVYQLEILSGFFCCKEHSLNIHFL